MTRLNKFIFIIHLNLNAHLSAYVFSFYLFATLLTLVVIVFALLFHLFFVCVFVLFGYHQRCLKVNNILYVVGIVF